MRWAILAQTADELHAVISAAPLQALHHTERPDGWSVVGALEHLADAELVFGVRLRQVLTPDHPVLQSFGQDRWAALGRHNAGDAAAAPRRGPRLRPRAHPTVVPPLGELDGHATHHASPDLR